MKKIILTITAFSLLLIPTIANASSVAIRNNNGIELTQSEYDNLRIRFTDDEIMNLSNEFYEATSHVDYSTALRDEKIIRIDTVTINGRVIQSLEKEVSEEEYLSFKDSLLSQSGAQEQASAGTQEQVHQTSMKRLTLWSWRNPLDRSEMSIHVTNEWLNQPQVRTFSIIGLRWNANQFTIYQPGSYAAMEASGGQYTNYNLFGGTNTKTHNNGIATSMNLYSNGNLYYNVLVINTKNAPANQAVPIWGSFQHCNAYAGCTLAESQNHTLGANGLGGVFNFGTTAIANKHDGMQGVYINQP